MSSAFSIPFLQQSDFLNAAQNLLPPGDAWAREADSSLAGLLNACVASLARVHARTAQLTEQEAFPPSSVELLPDWEAAFGLPDPCSPIGATIGQRQAALAGRISATGGQSAAYFISVAASLGYNITITTFDAAQFGVSTFGSPFYSTDWRYAWQVNTNDIAVFPATFGNSAFGDPFEAYSSTQLGCVLNRLKPAYSVLIIN
jgi:uncharacterized protein YmfQ (DUF2313 family)